LSCFVYILNCYIYCLENEIEIWFLLLSLCIFTIFRSINKNFHLVRKFRRPTICNVNWSRCVNFDWSRNRTTKEEIRAMISAELRSIYSMFNLRSWLLSLAECVLWFNFEKRHFSISTLIIMIYCMVISLYNCWMYLIGSCLSQKDS
jgi:hypothetical protein